MDQETILVVVVAGIKNKNEWLLIKRERGDYQQKWALVGGKMQFNESIRNATLREVFEETGLKVDWIGIKAVLNEKLRNMETGKTMKHFLIFLCQTKFGEGELRKTDEGELRWFSKQEIHNLKRDIIPSDYYMFNVLLERESLHSVIEIELIEGSDKLETGILEEY